MGKRVFVVDDHPGTLQAMAGLLRSLGHEAETIDEPRQAIAKASAFRPDIALLDVTMPHLDGCALRGGFAPTTCCAPSVWSPSPVMRATRIAR